MEVIRGLTGQEQEVRGELEKVKGDQVECFRRCDSCEREVERVSSKVVKLKVWD